MNCVYKIVCKDPTITEFYIGSTNNLYNREATHKSNCKHLNCYSKGLYMFIKNNGGWNNWEIVVLQETPNYNKNNRLKLEQLYKNKLKPILNKCNPVGIDLEKKKKNIKNYNKKKQNCSHCGKEMLKTSIPRHMTKCISSKLKIKT